MQSKSLYRLYRPLTFKDVVGQKALLSALTQAVKTKQLAHAYLFCGTRGTGKTSLARILARAVNCTEEKDGNPCNQCSTCQGILNASLLDVIEIDAASNNSVDHIRKLTEEVVFTPTVCRYKVYIIDEVHMLSTGAFNALLKTLEEPPAHVIFILATTEPHKIPQTILSRCQRYDLKSYTIEELFSRLKDIAEEQGILADESALLTLAKLGEGSFRDTISLLDQCRNQFQGTFNRTDVLKMAGLSSDEELFALLQSLSTRDILLSLENLRQLLEKGLSPLRLAHDFAWFFRDLLIYDFHQGRSELLPYMDDRLEMLNQMHQILPLETTQKILLDCSKLLEELKKSIDPRIHLELFLIKFMDEYFKDAPVIKAPIIKSETVTLVETPTEVTEQAITEPVTLEEPAMVPPVEIPATEPVVEPLVEAVTQPAVAEAVQEEFEETIDEPIVEAMPEEEPSEPDNIPTIEIPNLLSLWQNCLNYIQKRNAQLADILSSLNVSLENNTFLLHVDENDKEAKEKLKPKILEQLLLLLTHYAPETKEHLKVDIKWLQTPKQVIVPEPKSEEDTLLAWTSLLHTPNEEQETTVKTAKHPIQELCETLSIPYEEEK